MRCACAVCGCHQAKTVLAETPGSCFLDDCTNLLSEQQYEQFFARMLPHLDLIFSKSTDNKGEACTDNKGGVSAPPQKHR